MLLEAVTNIVLDNDLRLNFHFAQPDVAMCCPRCLWLGRSLSQGPDPAYELGTRKQPQISQLFHIATHGSQTANSY